MPSDVLGLARAVLERAGLVRDQAFGLGPRAGIALPRATPRAMMFEHEIEARLEHAGAVLLALPATGTRPAGYRCGMPPIVRELSESYGWEPSRIRPPVPSPGDIDRMDEALNWLSLIPADRYVLRRIVAARCLIAPLTGRHLYSWRQLGRVLGADHRAVQRWHADGIRCIARGLRGVTSAVSASPARAAAA
jgi:hypothetical protein